MKEIDIGLVLNLDKDTERMILWRKAILEDIISKLKPTHKIVEEYNVRIRELNWLLSKAKKVNR